MFVRRTRLRLIPQTRDSAHASRVFSCAYVSCAYMVRPARKGVQKVGISCRAKAGVRQRLPVREREKRDGHRDDGEAARAVARESEAAKPDDSARSAKSAVADPPGMRVDQSCETEQCRDAERASNEERSQHNAHQTLNVTKCIVSLARLCEMDMRENDNIVLRYRKAVRFGLRHTEGGNARLAGLPGRWTLKGRE